MECFSSWTESLETHDNVKLSFYEAVVKCKTPTASVSGSLAGKDLRGVVAAGACECS